MGSNIVNQSSAPSALHDVVGPRARARNRILSALITVVLLAVTAWIFVQLGQKGQLDPSKWIPFLSAQMWKSFLLPGLQGTVISALLSILGATALGILLGVGRLSHQRIVSRICGTLVEIFRATPALILMIFLFQTYANYRIVNASQLALVAVVSALTLSNGAVIAEIVRAGVRSLPKGQSEAAIALGLRPGQTMRKVLLPQAITAMLPALIYQMVIVLKDTALGYQITYLEIVRQGAQAGTAFNNYLPALLVVAAIMVIINFLLGRLAGLVEKRLRTGSRAIVVRYNEIDEPPALNVSITEAGPTTAALDTSIAGSKHTRGA